MGEGGGGSVRWCWILSWEVVGGRWKVVGGGGGFAREVILSLRWQVGQTLSAEKGEGERES